MSEREEVLPADRILNGLRQKTFRNARSVQFNALWCIAYLLLILAIYFAQSNNPIGFNVCSFFGCLAAVLALGIFLHAYRNDESIAIIFASAAGLTMALYLWFGVAMQLHAEWDPSPNYMGPIIASCIFGFICVGSIARLWGFMLFAKR